MALDGFSINGLRTKIFGACAGWQAGETRFVEMSSAERSLYFRYIPGPDEVSLGERECVARAILRYS